MRSFDPKLLIAIVVLIIAFGILTYSTRQTVVHIEDSRPFAMIPEDQQADAPDFTLTTADGQTVTLSQAVKKGPVMLDFWATWCGPCRMEMPELQKVYDQYKDRGLQLYGVNSNDKSQIIGDFSRDYHLEFPTLVDSQQKVNSAYGIQAIPFVVIVDKDMHITASNDGFDPNTKTDLPRTLDQMLGS